MGSRPSILASMLSRRVSSKLLTQKPCCLRHDNPDETVFVCLNLVLYEIIYQICMFTISKVHLYNNYISLNDYYSWIKCVDAKYSYTLCNAMFDGHFIIFFF